MTVATYMYVPREEQRAYTLLTCTYRIFAFKNSITVTQRGKRKNQEEDQSQDKVRVSMCVHRVLSLL